MEVFLGITARPSYSYSHSHDLINIGTTTTTGFTGRPSCPFFPMKNNNNNNNMTSFISVSRKRSSLYPRPVIRASLIFDSRTASRPVREGKIGRGVSIEEPEIIFVGTGTSDGVPRVSCLTNPMKICPVCAKAAEPGNKNRRRNTGLLIRYPKPSGTCNILIDVGKFFYHSALTLFPAYG